MESGKVRFYSQSESDGDDETKKAALSISSRQRRRDRRNASPARPAQKKSEPLDDSKKASAGRKLPSPPMALAPHALPPKAPEVKPTTVQTVTAFPAKTAEEKPTASPRTKKSKSSVKVEVSKPEDKKHERSLIDEPSAVEESSVDDLTSRVSTRPHFGVLKAVQAKMAEQSSLLSETVLDGDPGFAKKRPSRLAAIDPLMTSTAAKQKQSKSRQKHRASKKSSHLDNYPILSDDDAIPMVALKTKQSRDGLHNPAFDDSVELS